mgnify:FL=1
MIIIMNVIIAIIGIASIFIARLFALDGIGMGIRIHLLILASKLTICFVIIRLFMNYSNHSSWSYLILSGMTTLLACHFLEAFITQKKLIKG